MKANEFVKKHGFNGAYKLRQGLFNLFENNLCILSGSVCRLSDNEPLFSLGELKRLVESHELVAIHGFENSKEIVANAPSDDHFYSWTLGGSGVRDKTVNIGELRKAIADVESCQ